MSNKLFVGGISWGTDDDGLRAAFEEIGPVVEAKVILDRDTGRSRGFGFVTMGDADAAKEAIEKMNGAIVDGRAIRVNEANERGGGGGGGRGGGGGGRGGGGGGYGGGGGGYGGGGGGRGGGGGGYGGGGGGGRGGRGGGGGGGRGGRGGGGGGYGGGGGGGGGYGGGRY
ncbi:RNA recognition motif domain-containing protein [Plesiocystis pacifica]|uniref:RNA recognition motif domain-containing protein n=1 Tax=Plesiocystis pacifica TaxID=191768 RepID=UPI000A307798|nr:RNA-binding protein [Plesiocystis pacifica]